MKIKHWPKYSYKIFKSYLGAGGGGFFFLEQKKIFISKIGKTNFLHVNYIWGFSLFIEEDMSDEKGQLFLNLLFYSKLSYRIYQQRVLASFCFY